MLHGWTEFDAVSMERQLFNATLEARAGQPEPANTALRLRETLASTLVAIAARIAPVATVEQPRYTTAAHA
ncbi:MAG TPA: hypothetical protein VMM78_07960 [Thermomicrobiales bacterium]|nr:hypothetical protein [Thermomicrobiales bacterium]